MNRPFPISPAPDPLSNWRRALTAKAVATISGQTISAVAEEFYGADAAQALVKAAVSPADTSTTAWAGALAGTIVGPFLRSLRGRSAAAHLFDRALRFDFDGVNAISLPRLQSDFPAPAWVAEGAPIPAYQGAFAATKLGPPKKLAALAGLSGELASMSAENAELVIREVLEDAAAKALDASIFSDAAASATRPAGVLNGVTALAATTGGGTAAMVADIRNLIGALADAGANGEVIMIGNPRQAAALKLQAGQGFDLPIIGTTALAAGTIIAMDAKAFASGFGADPRVDFSQNAVVHMEDAAPLQISTAGAPNSVAAPVRSAWQAATHILRLILRAAWVVRQPGAVQYVAGASW